jgi:predicted lipoprotein
MSSLINGLRLETSAAARRKSRVRIGIFLVASLMIATLWIIKPPFVVRLLPGHETTGAGSRPAQSKAAAFVDGFWASLVPLFKGKAQDIAKVLPEIHADPNAAGEKYGRREATNFYNYMVKGTGKVTEINTTSAARTAIIEIPGLDEKLALQIGPVVRGTALRDATGLVSFNQFSNQLDYADVSKEMNARALKTAFVGVPATSLSGKSLTFYGAFTFDPHAKPPVLITPVKIGL